MINTPLFLHNHTVRYQANYWILVDVRFKLFGNQVVTSKESKYKEHMVMNEKMYIIFKIQKNKIQGQHNK